MTVPTPAVNVPEEISGQAFIDYQLEQKAKQELLKRKPSWWQCWFGLGDQS